MKLLAQFNINTVKVPSTGGLLDPNSANLGTIISKLLPFVFGAAGIALLIYLTLGGFQLMLAKGDPKAVQSAQGKLTGALIGFIIVILAFAIVSLIGKLFNIPAFGSIFGGGSRSAGGL